MTSALGRIRLKHKKTLALVLILVALSSFNLYQLVSVRAPAPVSNTNLAVIPDDWSLTYGSGPQIIHLDYDVTHNGHVSIRLDPHTSSDVNNLRECDGTWYNVKPGDHIVAKCWILCGGSGTGDTSIYHGARLGIDLYASSSAGYDGVETWPHDGQEHTNSMVHWGSEAWTQKVWDIIVPSTFYTTVYGRGGTRKCNPVQVDSMVLWLEVVDPTDSGKAWFSDAELYINSAPPPAPVLHHVVVSPSSASVQVDGSQVFSAQGYDQYGNLVSGLTYSWSVVGGVGSVSPSSGGSTTFTASNVGSGSVSASTAYGGVTKSRIASVTVTQPAPQPAPQPPVPSVSAVQVGANIGVYRDAGCTEQVSSISWGSLMPGVYQMAIVYVRNEGNDTLIWDLTTRNWQPENAFLFVSFLWSCGSTMIGPGQVVRVTQTLHVADNVPPGLSNFSFDIVFQGTLHFLGDINRDGVVNTEDQTILAAAYGSTPGDIRWNAEADLNKDGAVNLLDLMTLTNDWVVEERMPTRFAVSHFCQMFWS
jgi:hypothetical protein